MIGLACATLSAEGFDYRDFAATFEMLPAAGFRYVEFNLWDAVTMLPSSGRDLRERCEQSSLTPAAVYGHGFGAESEFDIARDVAHKVRLMEIARELGCSRVVATGCTRGEGGGLERTIRTLEKLLPAAEDLDMLICLENHAGSNLESVEDYARICEAIPSVRVGICIDTGHFDASDVDMDQLIDTLGERVLHLHVKENRGRGSVDFRRFGEGTTDNHHILERMVRLEYSGYITVELSPQRDRPTSVDDLRKAHEMFVNFQRET
jgi:sugar phosphate isomerase/epimerase